MTAPITPRPEAPKPEDVQAQYGFVAKLAAAIPEISALLQRATNEKWTADRFSMEVANTGWWKSTPSATRQWVTQQVADPASAKRALQTGGAQINDILGKLGFGGIPAEEVEMLWLNAHLAGFTEGQTATYVWNHMTAYGGANYIPTGGEAGQRGTALRQIAAQYGYETPRLDTEINDAIKKSLSSSQDRETGLVEFRNKMINYAKAKYSPFADRLDAGETVLDIARPYQDIYSQTLEVNPNSVTLDDPLIQRALQGGVQEAGKPPVAKPVWQFAEELRKDSRWGYTNNAMETAAKTATAIGKAFGMIG